MSKPTDSAASAPKPSTPQIKQPTVLPDKTKSATKNAEAMRKLL